MICESCVRGDCVCCLIDAPILDRFGKKWKALCECDDHHRTGVTGTEERVVSMKLFRISQEVNRGYDTYDSAVVCAESEEEARSMTPDEYGAGWTDAVNVKVEYLGKAGEGLEKGVIVASFNAG